MSDLQMCPVMSGTGIFAADDLDYAGCRAGIHVVPASHRCFQSICGLLRAFNF